MRVRARVRAAAAALQPAAFSMVMATGIVSTTAEMLGLPPVARLLLAVNLAAYPVLLLLMGFRVATQPNRVRDDLRSHARAPTFFAIVAGTCVLGTQLVVLAHRPAAAAVLWGLGGLLWFGLIYAFFTVLTILPHKPPLAVGLNGMWMLIVVGTQSVSVLGTLVAPSLGFRVEIALGFTLGLFLLGGMFYLLIFSLILYRFLFFRLDPELLTPPYWINMGAVAITTLAGSLLALSAESWAFLREILPFIKGLTLFFWATATWWIPLLLFLGAWRHIDRRTPLRYDPQYWSMVFPLGMYAVATFRLIQAIGWTFLAPLATAVGYLALAAWAVTFIGLLSHVGRAGAPANPGG